METANSALLAHAHPVDDRLELIREARRLHEQLVETSSLTAIDKSRIARRIVALLFNVEEGRNLSAHVRQCLVHLRTDADHRAGLSDAEGIRRVSEIWDQYERLEAAAP